MSGLEKLAARRPPIVWGPPLPAEPVQDDLAARSTFDRALQAALDNRIDDLLNLTREPWQTPAWTPEKDVLEIDAFHLLGWKLLEEGRPEDAYRLGTALLETDGPMICAYVGIHLRKKSEAGSQVLSVQTYHRFIRSEFDRWILPNLRGSVGNVDPDAQGWWRAREAAMRWVWGGRPEAFDRADTVRRFVEVRNELLAREPDEAFCMGRSLAEGPWLPVEMIQFLTSIGSSYRFAMSAPAFRFRPNGYGRYLVASLYASFARFSELFDMNQTTGRVSS
ncbi:hypothetical protein EON81_00315 [bacterium]|nr:MAG: hypothetical protein EON81_00315 [bacterium]